MVTVYISSSAIHSPLGSKHQITENSGPSQTAASIYPPSPPHKGNLEGWVSVVPSGLSGLCSPHPQSLIIAHSFLFLAQSL